jgi:hypothetical protein
MARASGFVPSFTCNTKIVYGNNLVMRKKKTYEDDDGRVIANMNIEGTPWYVKKNPMQDKSLSGESSTEKTNNKETFYIIRGALAAALLIALVFVAVFFIFLLFCTQVWFK